MKIFYTAFLFAFLTVISFQAAANCTNCTVTNKNPNQTFNLKSGETLCITSNFNGNINSFPVGATICIAEDVVFNPSSFTSAGGTINNYGTFTRAEFTVADGFTLNNYGTTTISGGFTGNTNIMIENMAGGILRMNALTLNSSCVLRNSGQAFINGDLTTNSNSNFINTADAKFYIGGNFTTNSTMDNTGYLRIKGNAAFNNSAGVINQCAMVIDGNISNNTYFKNTGNILLTNATGSMQSNSGFYNGPTGFVQGHHFTINGNVTGGGTFRFTGNTASNGNFGVDDDKFSINFYDATLASSQKFMDSENTTYGDVIRRTVNAKDTTTLLRNCGQVEESVLPLKLLAFHGQIVNGNVKLNWKVAENETGSYFELQKSTGGSSFKTATILFTSDENGVVSYMYADAAPQAGKVFYRLKMINKDGSTSYSTVLSFQVDDKSGNGLALLQNPALQDLKFSFKAAMEANAQVNVYHISGSRILAYTTRFYKGSNSISLPAGTWHPGMYVLEVISNGQRHSTQFIKQ